MIDAVLHAAGVGYAIGLTLFGIVCVFVIITVTRR